MPGEVEVLAPEEERLADGGRVEVFATHEALEEAMRVLGATAAPAWLMDRLRAGYGRTGEDLAVVELAIAGDSGLIGKSVTTANVAERYNVAILGVHLAAFGADGAGRMRGRGPVRRGRHPAGHRRDVGSSARSRGPKTC